MSRPKGLIEASGAAPRRPASPRGGSPFRDIEIWQVPGDANRHMLFSFAELEDLAEIKAAGELSPAASSTRNGY